MIDTKLKDKLDFYEKYYFALDEPVPFKKGLLVYPVKVKDYYDFYSCIPCLTMDKNVKKEKYTDEKGEIKVREVSNPKGIGMSYMAYLIEQMKDEEQGRILTSQLMTLLSMVLHEKNGLFCPHCLEECGNNVHLYKANSKKKEKLKFRVNAESDEFIEKEVELDSIIPYEKIFKDIEGLSDNDKIQYFNDISVCPHCGGQKNEIFSIKTKGPISRLCIYNQELTSQDFEELKGIIMHYNILNYDGDEYIDPDLKEEMEIKAQMLNRDYVSPTLEKQLVCISASTPYKIEELKDLTIRKMSYLLKVIDRKGHYFAQIQGMYSGMVKFKEDPIHWIFGDDSRDLKKDIMTMDSFNDKFSKVAGG